MPLLSSYWAAAAWCSDATPPFASTSGAPYAFYSEAGVGALWLLWFSRRRAIRVVVVVVCNNDARGPVYTEPEGLGGGRPLARSLGVWANPGRGQLKRRTQIQSTKVVVRGARSFLGDNVRWESATSAVGCGIDGQAGSPLPVGAYRSAHVPVSVLMRHYRSILMAHRIPALLEKATP